MGYKIHNNQRKVPAGKVRYQFYLSYNGKRLRENIICMRSVVEAKYREWEQSIIADSLKPVPVFISLFETLNTYIEYALVHKNLKHARHEKMVVETLKEYLKKDMNLLDFKRYHAEDYIQWRKTRVVVKYENTRVKGQLSNSTINRNIAVFSYFFNWCICREIYTRNNPFSMTKLPERNYREVMLTSEQLEELFLTARATGEAFHRAISILLLTGMRRGELFSLEWSEVNFDTRFIMLSKHKTKGKKGRAIPISPTLLKILVSLKKKSKHPGGLVMNGYTVNMLAKDWNKLLGKISFPVISDATKLRVHDLRHVYSQSLLNMGVSLEDIQSLLGHQDITTTQRRYAQFARPDLLEKGSKIDNVIKIQRFG